MREARLRMDKVEILHKPILIIASAGTGKTTRLTEDFLSALRSLDYDTGKILAITFTENAASEMRSRITEALVAELGMEGLFLAQRLEISTVDSFLRSELSRHSLLLGMSPDFEVMDEGDARALQRMLLADIMKGFLQNETYSQSHIITELNYYSYFSRYEHARTLEDAILTIYEKARIYGIWDFAKLNLKIAVEEIEGKKNRLKKAVSHILEACADEKARGKASGQLLRLADYIRQSRIDFSALNEDENAFFELLNLLLAFRLQGDKKYKVLAEELRQAILDYLPLFMLSSVERIREEVGQILVELDNRYSLLKRRLNAVDFPDLGLMFLKFLRENPEARRKYRERLSKIFVDEFQDLNPLQMQIISEICEEKCEYLVGDPKQSIYGFRYAHPREIIRKKERFEDLGGCLFHLGKNYRSRGEILEFVNEVFRLAENCGHSLGFEYAKLSQGAHFADKKEKSVALYCHEKTEQLENLQGTEEEDDYEKLTFAQIEALQVAKLIKESVEQETILTTKDGRERPLRYGDFAVLFRRSKNMGVFERALSAQGIPFVSLTGSGFLETSEVNSVCKLLQILLMPQLNFTCAEVLRSDLVGISSRSLYELFSKLDETKGESLFEIVMKNYDLITSENDKKILAEFSQVISRITREIPRMKLEAILEAVLKGLRFREKILAQPLAGTHSNRAEQNLEKLLHFAIELNDTGYPGILRFLAKISEAKYQGLPVPEMWVGGEDFVRLLTVHAAKGLTLTAVILADINFTHQPTQSPLLLAVEDSDFLLGVSHRLSGKYRSLKVESPGYDCVVKSLKKAEAEEELRLLYVALTRAVEFLAIVGISPEKRHLSANYPWGKILNRLLSWEDGEPRLLDGLEKLAELCVMDKAELGSDSAEHSAPSIREYMEICARSPQEIPEQEALEARSLLEEAKTLPDISEYVQYLFSVSEYLDWQASLAGMPRRKGAFIADEELEMAEEVTFVGEDSEDATALGSFVHRLLEIGVNYFRGEEAQGLVEKLLARNNLSDFGFFDTEIQQFGNRSRKFLVNFCESGLLDNLRKSSWVRTELPFLYGAMGCAFRGKVDLLYLHKEELILVDYKTEEIEASELSSSVEHYREQMLFYAEAIRNLFAGVPLKAYLFFLGIPRIVELPFGEEDFEGFRERLRRFIREKTGLPQKAFEEKTLPIRETTTAGLIASMGSLVD